MTPEREQIIRTAWSNRSDEWIPSEFREFRIPLPFPAEIEISLTPEYPDDVKAIDFTYLSYRYVEENFYNCVVGLVVCEGVYVWRAVVAQWP